MNRDKLRERLGADLLEYPVPKHANTLPYSLGGITLLGFIILGVSGILLAQYYNPLPESAYDSLEYIMGTAYLGWFLRGIHYWTAQIVMLTLILHVIRVVITASYKKPREVTWYVGVGLFAATYLGTLFTGTVLKWDQEGYEALHHSAELMEFLGPLGFWLSPEFAETVPLLTRVFIAHISILPLLLFLLVILHFFLVKAHKISPHPLQSNDETSKFTEHLKLLARYGLSLLFVASLLALLIGPPLGARPVEGFETGVKPWWMYLWYYALENEIGLKAILYGVIALFAVLLLIPLIDRGEELHPARRKPVIAVFAATLLILVVLSIYGYTAEIKVHVS
jgi:ubiquinol-cytochrome c reductase cytochrome b subunit